MYGATQRYDPNTTGSDANRYSLGNRTYNGTSPSPNVGPGSVDPAGYLDRDRQAAVKRNLLLQQAASTTVNPLTYGGK
jgi:hypothetical protein